MSTGVVYFNQRLGCVHFKRQNAKKGEKERNLQHKSVNLRVLNKIHTYTPTKFGAFSNFAFDDLYTGNKKFVIKIIFLRFLNRYYLMILIQCYYLVSYYLVFKILMCNVNKSYFYQINEKSPIRRLKFFLAQKVVLHFTTRKNYYRL